MPQKADIKEKIITAAIELIESSSGNIADVTTRAVCEKAGVGVGLVNYHFQSKDNLVAICVQRMISQVVASFQPEKKDGWNDKQRLTSWASQVFDFLFNNPAVSRISILKDFEHYQLDGNSVNTQRRFCAAMENSKEDSERRFLSFLLTSVMQAAFLGSNACRELLGYDFNKQEDRIAFITRLVSVLYGPDEMQASPKEENSP